MPIDFSQFKKQEQKETKKEKNEEAFYEFLLSDNDKQPKPDMLESPISIDADKIYIANKMITDTSKRGKIKQLYNSLRNFMNTHEVIKAKNQFYIVNKQ